MTIIYCFQVLHKHNHYAKHFPNEVMHALDIINSKMLKKVFKEIYRFNVVMPNKNVIYLNVITKFMTSIQLE